MFLGTNKIFSKPWCRSKKRTIDEGLGSFGKILKNYGFLTEQTIFNKLFKKRQFFRTIDVFKQTYFFSERTISPNKRLKWTNNFTKRPLMRKQTNEIEGKLTIILRTNEINFLNYWNKRTKWVVYEWWTNNVKTATRAHPTKLN